ncbi:hypothetical protein DICVIV_12070 [Dictyocaulus viviparus]|uniref:Uncharacterized protein n=1 Tax=Dictyocaulus viviparus TaxID=29172 RepID=A0A0D8XBE9_DICVI|nr:hypothetical protein DICVIV_12070 [Dictyocaulus viviparus]
MNLFNHESEEHEAKSPISFYAKTIAIIDSFQLLSNRFFTAITILVIITTMINDCVFWINIVQITTQRYPTVIRCIAFGSLHSIKHVGAIVALLIMKPLLTSWTLGAFVIPEILIVITIFIGFFLQPETKGKALMDQMIEANYGRLENEIPRALIRLAAGHKVAQMELREKYRKELEAVQFANRAGHEIDSPWIFKGAVPSKQTADGLPRYTFNNCERTKETEESQVSHSKNAASSYDDCVETRHNIGKI